MSISPGNGFQVPPVAPAMIDDALTGDGVDGRRDEALVDREADRDLDADRGLDTERVARDEVSEQEPAVATLPADRA